MDFIRSFRRTAKPVGPASLARKAARGVFRRPPRVDSLGHGLGSVNIATMEMRGTSRRRVAAKRVQHIAIRRPHPCPGSPTHCQPTRPRVARLVRACQQEGATLDASHPPTVYLLGAHQVANPSMAATESVMRTIMRSSMLCRKAWGTDLLPSALGMERRPHCIRADNMALVREFRRRIIRSRYIDS